MSAKRCKKKKHHSGMQNDHNVPGIMTHNTRHKRISKRRLKVSLMHKKKCKK